MTVLGIVPAAKDDAFWETARDWLLGVPLQVILIIVIALVVQVVFSRVIKRVVRRASERAKVERLAQMRKVTRTAELSDLLLNQRTEQRAAAIGSLLRSILAISVWTIALLMILPLMGVNVAPLIASAGVVGVALGFGAQTLIKDYISGIFIIIEDQYGVGDVVDVGEAIGTVEEVSLRYTRLRDLTGVVWYVRNGEILRVANRSQGWTLAIVDIPIAYNEDIEKVRAIVDRVAMDMDEDPDYDDLLLGRPAFAGVESMSGEAVVIRITAKAAPEKQVSVARTIRERMKLAFDRAGIVVPVLVRQLPNMPGTQGPPKMGP
ncbi:MAG: mechanosensitive ion channel family protein [Actinomycetota bacterium]|nr:mechanosensitive ion channel family protein [Actinomycetota bacterium]